MEKEKLETVFMYNLDKAYSDMRMIGKILEKETVTREELYFIAAKFELMKFITWMKNSYGLAIMEITDNKTFTREKANEVVLEYVKGLFYHTIDTKGFVEAFEIFAQLENTMLRTDEIDLKAMQLEYPKK